MPLVFSIVITVIALLTVYLGSRAVSALGAIRADIERISERLETIETMNRRMGVAVRQLERANAQLIATDRALDRTNGKLDMTDATLSHITAELGTMAGEMRSLVMMRSDIEIVTRKIGNSFLFRGVRLK
jgi:DNA repair ATPase RecN